MFLWNIAVTSLAEVWIEITTSSGMLTSKESLPSRKCGLKCQYIKRIAEACPSLPSRKCGLKSDAEQYRISQKSHFPRGSVG